MGWRKASQYYLNGNCRFFKSIHAQALTRSRLGQSGVYLHKTSRSPVRSGCPIRTNRAAPRSRFYIVYVSASITTMTYLCSSYLTYLRPYEPITIDSKIHGTNIHVSYDSTIGPNLDCVHVYVEFSIAPISSLGCRAAHLTRTVFFRRSTLRRICDMKPLY